MIQIIDIAIDLFYDLYSILNINIIVLSKSRRIQLQFATNRIIIDKLEPEIQPAKGSVTSLRWAYDVT